VRQCGDPDVPKRHEVALIADPYDEILTRIINLRIRMGQVFALARRWRWRYSEDAETDAHECVYIQLINGYTRGDLDV